MFMPEFKKRVKEALGLNSIKAAEETIDKFTALLADIIKTGEEIPLGNFGKLVLYERAAHKSRNPLTGDMIDVPAKNVVKLKPSGATKKLVNEQLMNN
jgi:DNA-binding protein HU-beta